MDEYKHYYRLNDADRVVFAFSDAFYPAEEGDYLVETGGRHFNPVITNERGQWLYKLSDDEIVERSQQELDDEWSARPPDPPTAEQKIEQLQADVASANDATLTAYDALADVYEMVLALQDQIAGGGGV